MVSPVGVDAAQSFTSVRAEVSRKVECPDLYTCLPEAEGFDPGEPLVASAIKHLDTHWRDQERPTQWLAFLAGQAFRELRREAALPMDDDAIGLYLSLPPPRPGWGPADADQLEYPLYNWAEQDPLAHYRREMIGHSGALGLCAEACHELSSGELRYAVVGGVDSYLFPRWLEPLDRAYRIRSDRNVDGFCPGEAAAFFLVEPEAQAAERGVAAWAVIRGAAGDSCALAPGEANTGATLAAVLEPLLKTGPSPLIVCGLNGEVGRMKEWAFTVSRLGPALGTAFALEHPARCLGDVGAASGAVLVALAVRFLHTKHRDRASALVWAASDAGDRRALLLERAVPPTGTAAKPQLKKAANAGGQAWAQR
jgi:3-oxoacyl-[acyl-carrier-protein] synthase-1